MGSFFVNFHIRTSDLGPIDEVLAGLNSQSRRTESHGGWVSVYGAKASSQDSEWITELAGAPPWDRPGASPR